MVVSIINYKSRNSRWNDEIARNFKHPEERFTIVKKDRARHININPDRDCFSTIDGASSLLVAVDNRASSFAMTIRP